MATLLYEVRQGAVPLPGLWVLDSARSEKAAKIGVVQKVVGDLVGVDWFDGEVTSPLDYRRLKVVDPMVGE